MSEEQPPAGQLPPEAGRRRTFAIISHPDAGKTTMTEKLLLFGGAIQLAGTVRSRKAARHATSDWIKLEQERGISVSTSVMQFVYGEHVVNLLDTPGHQDFSEDTYRTLTAVDSALMMIDAAKGVEKQTVKLFRICKQRNVPVMTFVNKLDREGRPALDLIAEVEDVLGMACVPFSWPAGSGKQFRGVYNLYRDRLELFRSGEARRPEDVVRIEGIDDPELDRVLGGGKVVETLREEVGLVREAGDAFDHDAYLAAEQTPTFFGSALNNFGVSEFLDALVELAPPPGPTVASERVIRPEEPRFSGFVFKIQANMNPQHRDRVAFLRVCSGRFEQGMTLHHVRTGKDSKVRNAISFLAQRRTVVQEAWPGDILGLHDKGSIQVGDSFTEGEHLHVTGIPHFAPELFRRIRLDNPLASKSLHKGLGHLGEEGAAQVFKMDLGGDLVVGAVGQLQFDVVAHRLQHEYGVEASFAPIDFKVARWLEGPPEVLASLARLHPHRVARDARGRLVVLAPTRFQMEAMAERYEQLDFLETMEIASVPAT